MSEFGTGEEGQVENESYCMKKSVEAKNVDEMNAKMGYHDMADLANTKRPPVEMRGEKANKQEGPKASDSKYNYDKNR